MNKLLPARKIGAYIPERRANTPYRPVRPNNQRQVACQNFTISSETKLFCALILLLVITGVGLIGMYGRVVAINYQVEQASREVSQLLAEQEYLNIEVKKLSSLERIENIAISELGLQYPDSRQWLLLSSREKLSDNPR